jgi:hypothetical protein
METTPPRKTNNDRQADDRAALKALLIVGVCVTGLLCLAYFGLRCLHYWAMRGLDERQRKALRTLAREPFVVPPEWQNPKPYSQGLIDAFAAWEAMRYSVSSFADYPPHKILGEMPDAFAYRIERTNEITADAATSLSLLTATEAAPLEAMLNLFRQPDFCLDVLDRPAPYDWVNGHEFTISNCFHWDWATRDLLPYSLAAQGDLTSATETAFELLDLTNGCMGRSMFIRGQCCENIARPISSLAYIATHTTETSRSRDILEKLGRFQPKALRGGFLKRNLSIDFWYTSQLRRIAREGYHVDFSQSVTGIGMERVFRNQYLGYKDWQLRQVPAGDPGYARIRNMYIPNWEDSSAPPITNNKAIQALSRVNGEAAELRLLWIIYTETLCTEDLPQTYLDLARLRIATHLFMKEKGRHPLSTRELVPEYLPAEPINNVTGKPYIWDPTRKAFHAGEPLDYYTRRNPSYGRL